MNRRPEVTSVFERKGWSQRGIDFSPTGRYVATYHDQGIALWVFTPHLAGTQESKSKGVWSRSHRFKHDSVSKTIPLSLRSHLLSIVEYDLRI